MDNVNVDNVDRFDKSSDKASDKASDNLNRSSDKASDSLNKTTESLLSKAKTKYALKKDAYEQHKQKIYQTLKEFLNETGGLNENKGIATLVDIMKKEDKSEIRIIPIQILNATQPNELLKEFITQSGITILGDWVSEYKEQIEKNTSVEQKIIDLLDQILNLSNRLPIRVKDLKTTKYGKQINKLGKCVNNTKIKGKCESIVERWKKMISDQKDKVKTTSGTTSTTGTGTATGSNAHSQHHSHSQNEEKDQERERSRERSREREMNSNSINESENAIHSSSKSST